MAGNKGTNGRRKGSSYELKIAKQLSKWWGFDFHRTPGSGSWSSTHNSDMQAGDIITPEKANFPFVVECKNQEKWSDVDIIFNQGQYPKYWAQVVGDARRVKKVPMLIAHRNFSRNYVSVPYATVIEQSLEQNGFKSFAKTPISYKNDLTEEPEYFMIITCTLEDFTETFSPKYLTTYTKVIYPEWFGKDVETSE